MENSSATCMTRLLGTANVPPQLLVPAAWNDNDLSGEEYVEKRLPKVDTYIERSFQKRFFLSESQPEADRYIYLHPNGLCILGVAATHGAVRRALERKGKEEREGNACDKVESQANANTNANANAVLATEFNPKWTVSSFQFDGKKRLNAPYVHVDTKICSLKVRGAAWDVRCGIKGKLLELNSRLMEEPELWSQMPASEGWIAVIQPQSKDIEDMMACTTSFQEYITRRASVLKEILALSQGPEIIL